jgi:predicted transcriptional regulator
MAKQIEEAMKAEQRTRSELVREALRAYLTKRVPVVAASKAELAAIRRGRTEIENGEYITLDELLHGLAAPNRKTSRKKARKGSA